MTFLLFGAQWSSVRFQHGWPSAASKTYFPPPFNFLLTVIPVNLKLWAIGELPPFFSACAENNNNDMQHRQYQFSLTARAHTHTHIHPHRHTHHTCTHACTHAPLLAAFLQRLWCWNQMKNGKLKQLLVWLCGSDAAPRRLTAGSRPLHIVFSAPTMSRHAGIPRLLRLHASSCAWPCLYIISSCVIFQIGGKKEKEKQINYYL